MITTKDANDTKGCGGTGELSPARDTAAGEAWDEAVKP